MPSKQSALLALEDGRTFRGFSWAAEGEACGEMVFNTSMTGYQEVLTDPSYAGQIVCMTYPLIGNYGVNEADAESSRPWVEGFVVREASRITSNWRAEESLESYLKRWNIVALEGIDTRALVRHIRDKGAMRACLSTVDLDESSLVEKARQSPRMENRELASVVTTKEPYDVPAAGEERFHVVCYDFGVKRNSLRELAQLGVRTTVVPASTPAADVLAMNPDGIFLSNGPGDPASMNKEVEEIRALLQAQVPLFGICFGHQLLGRAFGGQTFKLVFGHRGGNQPVKEVLGKGVEITSHNHGFAVKAESLPADVEVTHINLNDQCVEGMRHRTLPAISVQYHPEAAPGPHDAEHHFRRFVELMERQRSMDSTGTTGSTVSA
ncbi:MAG TPA: glutamine-hydrolyzing carbamoyl-phosphate synthase small subunit [Pyrinomonadaceae bacterium]|jgi:carbamoyl-phosphate synthase small subunit|nr:glutamine-hydrolyzing carbamoyl-phosphate synthase small subunit [Pyrinomonadaceae bacterium]